MLGIFLTVFTLLLDFMKRRKKWRHYPPGPMSLPFVGTMPYIDFHNPHLSFNKVSASPAGQPAGWGRGRGNGRLLRELLQHAYGPGAAPVKEISSRDLPQQQCPKCL